MEQDKDREILRELAEYRSGLQNMLAQQAVEAGFLKDSVRSIPELSGLVRSFFEHCIREYHSLYDHVEPLAVLGSCCFAGAAAAHLWEAVGEELLGREIVDESDVAADLRAVARSRRARAAASARNENTAEAKQE